VAALAIDENQSLIGRQAAQADGVDQVGVAACEVRAGDGRRDLRECVADIRLTGRA
jgi:hypothetical protein